MARAVEILCLNQADVRSLLTFDACIPLMRQAMTAVSRGDTVQPIRQSMFLPGEPNLLSMMPGYLGTPRTLGIKVLTVFPGNFGTDVASHQGLVTIYDPGTGEPRAIIDAASITSIRTAAASAVATAALMRPDSKTLLIMGYGEQSESHAAALPHVMRPERILVWGRSLDKAKAFAADQANHHGVPAEAVEDPEQAAAKADVICTTTSSPNPILLGRWLKPGVHVNVVGSSVPMTREIDSEAVAKSRFFVDFVDSTRALGGDFRTAVAEGAVKEDHILGEVGAVLSGKSAGRTGPGDITMFKSLGMVSEDLVSANYLLETAKARGIGQWITM